MNPLISIVIPTYNHAHFLGKAIQSVLDQTYTNWELLIIDNHSEDQTDKLVNDFRNNKIKLLKIHNNGVIAASRNMGIYVAKGEWVAFLDSDDSWYPRKLEQCMKLIESGYDLVCHGEVWVFEKEGTRICKEVFYGPEARASFDNLLFEGNCISTSAVIVSRKYLKLVDYFNESEDLITAEDYHLWLKLARVGARIGFINEILGEYIIHDTNSSKAALRHMEAVRASFEKVFFELKDRSLKIRIKSRRRQAIIDYGGARGLQNNGEFLGASKWFLKAIARWPFRPKFYAALILNTLNIRSK
jgi:glycosyltransferase involved in cell wall biosynthesis